MKKTLFYFGLFSVLLTACDIIDEDKIMKEYLCEATGHYPGISNFEHPDIETGVSYNVHCLLDQDQIVVLDFFADWCHPCYEYAPETNALYETYGPNGTGQVTFLAVDLEPFSDDEVFFTPLSWQEESWAERYDFPLLNLPSELASQMQSDYQIVSYPQYYVLAPTGTFVNLGGAHEQVEEVILDFLD